LSKNLSFLFPSGVIKCDFFGSPPTRSRLRIKGEWESSFPPEHYRSRLLLPSSRVLITPLPFFFIRSLRRSLVLSLFPLPCPRNLAFFFIFFEEVFMPSCHAAETDVNSCFCQFLIPRPFRRRDVPPAQALAPRFFPIQ